MALNLSRNTKILASTVASDATEGFTRANTFEMNVLDGYSFSQSTNVTDITLNEAGITPQRGKRSFNDSLAPVDWSFTTYIRPYQQAAVAADSPNTGDPVIAAGNTSPDRLLWAALWGDALGDVAEGAIVGAVPYMRATTATSALAEPMKIQLYFVMDNTVYHLENACVNTVEIDFSIDGIAQATWSGYANVINDFTAIKESWVAGTDYRAVPTTADFIRNKLSTVSLEETGGQAYSLALTGGSISIDNGITFLTPEELGVRNTPIGSFTGARQISGTMNAYLKTNTDNDTGDLFDAMTAKTGTENMFSVTMNMGGTWGNGSGNGTCTNSAWDGVDESSCTSDAPNATPPYVGGIYTAPPVLNLIPSVKFTVPAAQLQVPTVDVQDVVATTINFSVQGTDSTGNYDIGADNEMTVDYYNTSST